MFFFYSPLTVCAAWENQWIKKKVDLETAKQSVLFRKRVGCFADVADLQCGSWVRLSRHLLCSPLKTQRSKDHRVDRLPSLLFAILGLSLSSGSFTSGGSRRDLYHVITANNLRLRVAIWRALNKIRWVRCTEQSIGSLRILLDLLGDTSHVKIKARKDSH